MLQSLNYLIPIATFILGILGYERIIRKDSEQQTKNMSILITKVDMLLTQSSSLSIKVEEHGEMLIKHDVKIQDIENTLKFRRIKDD